MKRQVVFWEWLYIALALISVLISLEPSGKYAHINHIIYICFIIEYVVKLVQAKCRLQFIKNHPLDLVLLLPISGSFRILRFIRVVKIFKLNVSFAKRFPRITAIFSSNELGTLIGWLVVTALAVCIPLTMIEPQMTNYFDALWWTVVTTTTVGYGDIVPVTMLGKLIAILLMLFGVGIVGMLIGNMSNVFLVQDTSSKTNLFELSDFEKLDPVAKARIKRRIQEEIELELYKSKQHSSQIEQTLEEQK